MPTAVKDAVLIQIVEEMSKPLAHLDVQCSVDEIISSYNALLGAVQANHPDVLLLKALEPLPHNCALFWSIFRPDRSAEDGQ